MISISKKDAESERTQAKKRTQLIVLSDFSSSVDHRPAEGIYDLTIEDATYDRDNGQFECRMKEGGTGQELHSKSVELTVLLRPSPPSLNPATPTATEGRLLNLTCSSLGGSPPPQIHWYNEANSKLLDAALIKGKNKDEPTMSVLSVMPTKEDDGSQYRCTVWNRALAKGQKMETKTKIFVNCKFQLFIHF